MVRRPFLDHPGPIPFAHRGGAIDAPENSLEAFGAAVDLGYRYLETDVHVTADGRLVAFHDPELDRVTDRRGAIADLTWAEVSRARVDGTDPIMRNFHFTTEVDGIGVEFELRKESAGWLLVYINILDDSEATYLSRSWCSWGRIYCRS